MSDERRDDEGLSAAKAVAEMRAGRLQSEALLDACLAVVDQREGEVQAWTALDRDHARAQARTADEAHRIGASLGPLHGLPVGVKDIIDTRALPTENGTPFCRGRQPGRDASVVAQLQQAGAYVMGKTVTTELAVYSPGKTRNPHDPGRTPGGSSSGSAAAVAAGMVPAALGSQTNGSVIRPASFCGVVGYKPTHGLMSRTGVLSQSPFLDTLGVFAGSVEDAALLAGSLMTYDPLDPDMVAAPPPALYEICCEEPPLSPRFAFVEGPGWPKCEETTREAFSELAEALGELCQPVGLSERFDKGVDLHRTIMLADLAKSFAAFYERDASLLSDTLRGMIEEGQKIAAVDYNRAREWRVIYNDALDELFDEVDAILTPATLGEAPQGLEATGDPTCCTLWTFCGTPAISLPLLEGPNGMPLGVQLVGRRGDDARLLRTARWLVGHLRALAAESEAA
ncbi:MAG: amidase [Rhodovibrionaceae bacterium]|nr:amidase [Rhodovibrionaceae bacterium]